MLTKPIAVAGLAAAVIGAAGGGAYLAVRQNAAEVVDTTPAAPLGALASAGVEPATPVGADRVVEATEQTLDPIESAPVSQEPEPEPEAPEIATPPARMPPSAPPEPAPARQAPIDVPAAEDSTTARAAPPPAVVAPRPEPPERPDPEDEPTPVAATPQPSSAPDPATPAIARTDLPTVEGWGRPANAEPATPRAPDTTSPLDGSPIARTATREPEPLPVITELEIAADSVIGLQVDTGVSTRNAEVEDPVEARVTRDVLVADEVAVPAGTRVLGSVVLSEQGGKLRNASRLGVRFHTLVMDDGYQVPMVTETIYREGDSRGDDNVAKIGGAAVGGAILGAIFGGGRGAAIGGSIGAAGGTAAAMSGDAEPAGLPPGSRLTVRLSRPLLVTVEQ